MAYTDTELCQLNGGCVGCCGRDYAGSESVEVAIDENTLEFKDFKRAGKGFKEFRDRSHKDDLRNGLCRNAIRHRGKVLCSIHPLFAKTEKDLRKRHCDIKYLCPSAKAYEQWDNERKKEFRVFLSRKRKHMSQIQYSLAMDADLFLEEFMR